MAKSSFYIPPAEEATANRQRIIDLDRELKTMVSQTPLVALNLGCGRNPLKGFVNIDKYVDNDSRIKVMDMVDLEYRENSVDIIYSSHSIEHLPIRRGHKALITWFKILKPGGFLFLSLPDLHMIMRILSESRLSAADRCWYTYCLFGYQADMDADISDTEAPEDAGQFHCNGWIMELLIQELTGIGYKIDTSFHYDGFRTPGLFVKAMKP